MAGYLGIAMVAGYWSATQFTASDDLLHEASWPSGITASTRPLGFASRPAVVYGNCAEARAAGAAPIHRGEPGYSPRLDRDNDGVACEPYHGRSSASPY